MKVWDVIVVGGGPVGSYCAAELARAGFEVLLLEEHEQVGEPVHCTGIIGVEAYRRFPLPADCIQSRFRAARFFSPRGIHFDVESQHEQAVAVDRAAFDRALARDAQRAGVKLLLNAMGHSLQPREDGVRLDISNSGGPSQVVGKMCILATGVAARPANHSGLGEMCRFVYAARADVKLAKLETIEVHFGRKLAPGGFAWAVPLGDSRARVGLLSTRPAEHYLDVFLDSLERQGRLREIEAMVRCRPIPCSPRRPSFAQRVLAVGDAAGQVKTTTGGGIFYGLLGAQAASQAVRQAFSRGEFRAGALSSYEREWMGRIGFELSTGLLFRRIGCALSDWQIDEIFRAIKRTGLNRKLAPYVSFDWHAGATMLALRQGRSTSPFRA
jgi:geranylgeranyl reductase family protein